jgi:hypothetical protein
MSETILISLHDRLFHAAINWAFTGVVSQRKGTLHLWAWLSLGHDFTSRKVYVRDEISRDVQCKQLVVHANSFAKLTLSVLLGAGPPYRKPQDIKPQ